MLQSFSKKKITPHHIIQNRYRARAANDGSKRQIGFCERSTTIAVSLTTRGCQKSKIREENRVIFTEAFAKCLYPEDSNILLQISYSRDLPSSLRALMFFDVGIQTLFFLFNIGESYLKKKKFLHLPIPPSQTIRYIIRDSDRPDLTI